MLIMVCLALVSVIILSAIILVEQFLQLYSAGSLIGAVNRTALQFCFLLAAYLLTPCMLPTVCKPIVFLMLNQNRTDTLFLAAFNKRDHCSSSCNHNSFHNMQSSGSCLNPILAGAVIAVLRCSSAYSGQTARFAVQHHVC